MADAGAPRRTVVFVATTAEEAGMLGSKHYVEQPVRPREGIRSVLNIDSVGRLGTAPLGVIGSATATEWPHVFRGIGFVTGIQTQFATQGLESSDQASFIARGIPAVQLFTPPHTDYHRPGDTADKVDIAGLVRVATVAREAVTLSGGAAGAADHHHRGARRPDDHAPRRPVRRGRDGGLGSGSSPTSRSRALA